jgi:hypothetical protein
MKEVAKQKKKLNPVADEKINKLQKRIKSIKMEAKAELQKKLNDQRIKLHKLVSSFAKQGWPEDYETLKSNIQSIIEE